MAKEQTGWEKAAKASKQKKAMGKMMEKSKTKSAALKNAKSELRLARREYDSTIARNPEMKKAAQAKYMAAATKATTLPSSMKKPKFKFKTGPGTGRNSRHGGEG